MLTDPATIDADYARTRIVAHAARRHRAAGRTSETPSSQPTVRRAWLALIGMRSHRRAAPHPGIGVADPVLEPPRLGQP